MSTEVHAGAFSRQRGHVLISQIWQLQGYMRYRGEMDCNASLATLMPCDPECRMGHSLGSHGHQRCHRDARNPRGASRVSSVVKSLRCRQESQESQGSQGELPPGARGAAPPGRPRPAGHQWQSMAINGNLKSVKSPPEPSKASSVVKSLKSLKDRLKCRHESQELPMNPQGSLASLWHL